MAIGKKIVSALFFSGVFAAAAIVNVARAGAREEGRLLTATEVLEEVQAMPDQRLPDALLSRAYGIAVIPDVTKVAFIFGGRHGNGALVVRDKLTSSWSNPVLISLTGGSWGFQAGAQSSDIILVFTTKTGIEGIAGGKLALGADASVAAGPVGAARIRGNRHPVQFGNLLVCKDARSIRRHRAGWQRHFHRPIGERIPVRQTRRDGLGDFLRAGADPAAHGATLSRTARAGHSQRRAHVPRAASRHSGCGCRSSRECLAPRSQRRPAPTPWSSRNSPAFRANSQSA